jgi:hypothetical protein
VQDAKTKKKVATNFGFLAEKIFIPPNFIARKPTFSKYGHAIMG